MTTSFYSNEMPTSRSQDGIINEYFGQTSDFPGCELNHRDQYGFFTGTVVFREEGFTEFGNGNSMAAPAQTLKCVGRSS